MGTKIGRVLGALTFPALLLMALLLLARPSPSVAQSGVTNVTTLVARRDIRAGAFIQASPVTSITLTMNGWLTPTGTFQPIRAAGAVSTSGARIAVQPAGTQLILLNVGSNTITFTETGTLISAGNIALQANDSATLISNGTNWYQIAASNN